jgi:hypothetical protein
MSFIRQNLNKFIAIITLPLVVSTLGCGTQAVISTRYNPHIEGTITGSSQQSMHVEKEKGNTTEVPHADVVDIDHPGNVAATIGGVVAAYGVANIAIGASNCDRQGAAYCVGVFTPAIIGGSLLIYGLSVWGGSKAASTKPDANATVGRVFVTPAASFKKNNEFVGANVAVAF